MQGLAGLLESTGVPKTVERLAYGEPLTNLQQANIPALRPETANALMTLLPNLPMAGRAIQATKGLPVGMSIKNIKKSQDSLRTFKTSDGFTLYELPNGKIVDNLDPQGVDMSWDSFKQLKDDFGDDVYQVQDELGKRRAAISSTGNPNLLDDFASFMAVPEQQELYQQALNKQKKPVNNVVPFPRSGLLD
jgi:hypothetical protein